MRRLDLSFASFYTKKEQIEKHFTLKVKNRTLLF